MSDFEKLEALGQTSIFDFLKEEHRKKELDIGDKVMIRFYVDELEQIRKHFPWMLSTGFIVGAKLDFWIVEIEGRQLAVEKNKLIRSE